MADNRIIIEVGVTGDAELKFKKLTESVEQFGDRGEKSLVSFNRIFESFAGNLTADAVLGGIRSLAATFGELFQTLVVDGVRAAQEQEDAVNQLNQALAASGQFSAATSESLQQYAAALQGSTKFADEAIVSASALIQNLGRLDQDGLKRATGAALDLSAALGVDLNTAATIVGKAAAGEVGSLSRYGIKIQEGADKAETFSRALDALNSRFGGAAEAQLNTYSGAVAKLTNEYGEVLETIGNAVIKNQSLINVLNVGGQLLAEFNSILEANRGAFSALVSNGIILAIDALSLTVTAAKYAAIAFVDLEAKIVTAKTGAVALAEALTFRFGAAVETLREGGKKLQELGQSARDLQQGNGVLGSMSSALERLRKAAVDGATQEGVDRIAQSFKNAAGGATEFDEAQKKLVDTGRQLAEQLAAKDPNAEYATKLEALQAFFEAERVATEERNILLEALEQDRFNKVSALKLQEAELIIQQNQLLTTDGLFQNQTQIDANQQRLLRISQDENLSAKDRTKIQQAFANQSKIIEEGRRVAISDSLTQLATLQNAKTKELAAVGKAAAIAQTVIETYSGATKAASALAGIPFVGPALAAAAAAAFITAGLARVAMISGVPLATGGEIPAGFNNDTFPARLSSGENVVDRSTNMELKAFLSGANQMVPLLAAILAQLQANVRQPMIINLGGRVLLDELRDGLRSGRTIDV